MDTSDIFFGDSDYYGPCTWFTSHTEYVGFIGNYPHPALHPYASSHRMRPRRWKTITFDRAPAPVRETWSDARRAKEQRAWDRLVQANAAMWWGRIFGLDSDEIWRESDRAKHYYWAAARYDPDKERRRQIPMQLRKTVMQRWEANGRICAICSRVVDAGQNTHIHHISPIAKGGETTLTNLDVAHERCNLSLGDGKLLLREEGVDKGAKCKICSSRAMSAIHFHRGPVTIVRVLLCTSHLRTHYYGGGWKRLLVMEGLAHLQDDCI